MFTTLDKRSHYTETQTMIQSLSLPQRFKLVSCEQTISSVTLRIANPIVLYLVFHVDVNSKLCQFSCIYFEEDIIM